MSQTYVPRIELVDTSKLSAGDIVHTHGMRVLLESDNNSHNAKVYAFAGRILNMDYVKANPSTFGRIVATSGPNEAKWTIQGNVLARWAREVG